MKRTHSFPAPLFILFFGVITAQANLQDLLSKVNVTAALDIEGNVPLQSVQLDGLVNYLLTKLINNTPPHRNSNHTNLITFRPKT